MGISAENFAAVQTLTTALCWPDATPAACAADRGSEACDRRLLWRFGISGDRPIVLVSAGVVQGLGLLRSLVQALRLWSWGGVACDLVVVNAEPRSYLMALQREIGCAARAPRRRAAMPNSPAPPTAGFYLLRADELPADELSDAAGPGTGAAQRRRPAARCTTCRSWTSEHEQRLRGAADGLDRGARPAAWPPRSCRAARPASSRGHRRVPLRGHRAWLRPTPALDQRARQPGLRRADFRGRRRLHLGRQQPPEPAHAWSNDPVADPPAEWFLLQDRRRCEVWSVAPSAAGDSERRRTASRTARATAASATAAATWR